MLCVTFLFLSVLDSVYCLIFPGGRGGGGWGVGDGDGEGVGWGWGVGVD